MKKVLTVQIGIVVTGVTLFSSALTAVGASGVWTNEVDGLWSNPAAWLNGVVADGAGYTATFSNEASATVIVGVDSPRTIGNLSFIQGTYTITNNGVVANSLTLAGPPKPVIHVPSGLSATLGGIVMAGIDGFILDGSGTLNIYKGGVNAGPFDPPNTWTGGIVLSNGTLQIQGDDPGSEGTYSPAIDNALDGITSIVFYNGSVLNLRPQARTRPGYGNLVVDLIVPEGQSGTIVLPPRFSGAAGDNSAAIGEGLGGTLTGSGTLGVNTIYVRAAIVGDWSAFAGRINVWREGGPTGEDKQFRVGHPAGLPNAHVDLGGNNDYGFFYYRSVTAGTVYPIGLLTGDNPQAQLRGSASAGVTLMYDIGAKQTNSTDIATFSGAIVDATGPAGVTWRGAGTWVLTGNNTYSGPTIISNGIVQVGDGWSETGSLGTGPITNYSKLVLARGGTLWIPGGIHGPGSLTNAGPGTNVLSGISTYTGPTVITAGKLELGTGSVLPGSFTVRDGASLGVRMQSANGAVRLGSLTFGSGCTLDYEFGPFSNPTSTVLTNAGVLGMNGTVTVNIAGSALGVGSITLLEYSSRTGSGSFVLGALPPHVTGAYITDDTLNRRVVLTITSIFDPTLVWVGDAAGVWDVGNPANLVWKVAGSGAQAYYTDGKMVRFDDTATGTTTIDISSTVAPSLVTVDNSAKDYAFGGYGSIAGSGTLIKRGTGKLTVNINNNTWSGGTLIESGSIQLGDGTTTTGNLGSGPITNNATLLCRPAADQTIGNVIRGTGWVVQEGPGQLTLSGANAHTGGVIVRSNATFVNANGDAVGGAGSTLVLDSAILSMTADIFPGKTVLVLKDSAVVNGAARRIDSPIIGTNVTLRLTNGALMTFTADLNGFYGTIELDSQTSQSLRFNAGGANTCTGSTNALFYFNPPVGATNWLISRNGGTMYLGGIAGGPGRIDQGGTAVSLTLTWVIGWLNQNNTWTGYFTDSVRTNALTKVGTGKLTLENVALEHKGAVIVNNGILAFKGATVNSPTNMAYVVAEPGILDLSEANVKTLTLGTTAFPQTLAGNGTIRGSVVLAANARLEPGTAVGVLTLADPASLRGTIGVLTVTDTVTLGGVTLLELNKNASPNSDRLVANSITGGGTLIVTNIGPALMGGDTFTLFSRPVSGFTSVTLPPLNPPLYWTNMLAIDGTIRVLSMVPTTPTNITLTRISATQIQLEWPASYIGWRLETNAVSITATNQWFTWVNSTTTNRVIIDVDQSKTNVYFRLVYP